MAGQQRGEAGMFLGDGGHAPIVRFPRAFGKNETDDRDLNLESRNWKWESRRIAMLDYFLIVQAFCLATSFSTSKSRRLMLFKTRPRPSEKNASIISAAARMALGTR